MSTTTSKLPSHLSQKASNEKKRREEINGKMDELRDLVFPNNGEKHISQGKVLQRAVEMLRGDTVPPCTSSPPSSSFSSSSSSSPSPNSLGPMRSRKEIRKNREQCRRDLQGSGYEALREYITANVLTDQPERLDRVSILDITITQLRNMAPVSPSTLPSAVPVPLLPPLPLLPLPIFANPQLLFCYYYMMAMRSFAPAPLPAVDPSEQQQEDNEEVDVTN